MQKELDAVQVLAWEVLLPEVIRELNQDPVSYTHLVILPEANKNVYLSARNVESANVQTVSGLNT